MSTGLYLAGNAFGQLDAAQHALDKHPRMQDGRCGGCGAYDCPTYEAATSVFARYRRMPHRRPGLTRERPR
jgi:hypothetical protein